MWKAFFAKYHFPVELALLFATLVSFLLAKDGGSWEAVVFQCVLGLVAFWYGLHAAWLPAGSRLEKWLHRTTGGSLALLFAGILLKALGLARGEWLVMLAVAGLAFGAFLLFEFFQQHRPPGRAFSHADLITGFRVLCAFGVSLLYLLR